MPRLSEEQIKAGILHADPGAREAAVRYFADSYSPDPSVMPVVIETIERYGLDEAFPLGPSFHRLAQTEETLRWALARLKAAGDSIDAGGRLSALCEVVCAAYPRLVAPLEAEALSALA